MRLTGQRRGRGISNELDESEGTKTDAEGETPTSAISTHDLEIQQKVLQIFETENMSIEPGERVHGYFILTRPIQSYIS